MRAIKHCATQRLEVSRGDQFAKGTGMDRVVMGQQTKIRIAKNKIAAPYKTATLDLYFDTGVDKIAELVNVAKAIGVLNGTSWLKFMDPTSGEVFSDANGNEIKFNGATKTIEALKYDIQNNGGELYYRMFDVVNEVLRS